MPRLRCSFLLPGGVICIFFWGVASPPREGELLLSSSYIFLSCFRRKQTPQTKWPRSKWVLALNCLCFSTRPRNDECDFSFHSFWTFVDFSDSSFLLENNSYRSSFLLLFLDILRVPKSIDQRNALEFCDVMGHGLRKISWGRGTSLNVSGRYLGNLQNKLRRVKNLTAKRFELSYITSVKIAS